MDSNGSFRTRGFKLENLTALDFFLSIVLTVANYWIIVILFCATCLRDFCEIFIFTTLKIVQRVIWTLEIIGFEQINDFIAKSSRLVLSQGIGTQTDLSLHNVTEKPISSIKFRDATVSLIEKECQTSPFSQNPVYNQEFALSQHQYFTPPQTSNSEKYALNVVGEVEKIAETTIAVNAIKTSPVNPQHMSQSPVRIIHPTPCSTIKFKNTIVSHADKKSQVSPQTSVNSQDFTSSLHQDFTSSLHQDFTSSLHQDFTSQQQNNTEKYDLNVVEEVEKLAKAIITVNDLTPSPMNPQHTSQSPVCTIHLTPCSSNHRAKYSKVLVNSMSPEESSYMRRKWNSLKKGKKRSYLKMQPVFPSNTEDSSNERRPKKARIMNIQDCDNDNMESVLEVDSPEMNGCYKNLFLKLKSKLTQRKDVLVSYKHF